MYLLMLLATFMASIYGYNLSARPDYDRDIAKKKAASIIFKFGYQFKAVRMVIVDIINGNFKAADGADIPWILPGDMFYARFDASGVDDNEDIHTFVNQQGSEHLVYLRAKNKQGQDNIGAKDYLMAGRRVYDGSEMGFKILCLDKPMNENGSKNCISTTDADGNITKSCCHVLQDGWRYMVAYKKLDARWINRISGEVTLDFIKALAPKVYYDNIGVIRWGKTPGKNEMAWQFRGKINFLPVYADDLEEWQDKTNNTQSYPVERRNRAEWTLPVWIFGKDFFQSKVNGKMETICDENQPCLFKIQSF